MEMIRKVYLSLSLFSIDISIGRTVPKFGDDSKPLKLTKHWNNKISEEAFEPFPFSKYSTTIPITNKTDDYADLLNNGFTASSPIHTKKVKKLKKIRKSSYDPEYYKKLKARKERQRKYRLNINGYRDKAIAASKAYRARKLRERAL